MANPQHRVHFEAGQGTMKNFTSDGVLQQVGRNVSAFEMPISARRVVEIHRPDPSGDTYSL